MQIRNKLTYQFVSIVASVLLVASVLIFIIFSEFRKREFYVRLNEKAVSTAKLLLQENDVDAAMLKMIDKNLLGLLPRERVIIIDKSDKEIYRTDDERVLDITSDLISKIRKKKHIEFSHDDFEFLGIIYNYEGTDYVVVAGAYDKYGIRKLWFLGGTLLAVFFISSLVVYLSGWIYAGRALKPISRVISDVNNISVSNLNARVDEGNGQDEIASLAQTFNKMLERIETAFKVQRAFVGNASHELRNPLSVIRGQLEVTLLKDRQKEDYRKTMISVLEDINHLTVISNRLLSLAQVSGGGMAEPKSPLRMDELLLQSRSELIANIPEYNVIIEFESIFENEELITVAGNERLLKIAFFNLIENACKYSDDHSCSVHIGTEKNNIVIRFSNNGIGIPKEDLKNIFEPFYRGKNVLDRRGHGIGLSLVEKIILLHGGSVEVNSIPNELTVFTVKLPLGE